MLKHYNFLSLEERDLPQPPKNSPTYHYPSSTKFYSWHNTVRQVTFSWHPPNPDLPIRLSTRAAGLGRREGFSVHCTEFSMKPPPNLIQSHLPISASGPFALCLLSPWLKHHCGVHTSQQYYETGQQNAQNTHTKTQADYITLQKHRCHFRSNNCCVRRCLNFNMRVVLLVLAASSGLVRFVWI